jgi:hypothetical protein
VENIAEADPDLGGLLTEMYAALNNDLRVLAAIGARTAFDRSSELLGVDASLPTMSRCGSSSSNGSRVRRSTGT